MKKSHLLALATLALTMAACGQMSTAPAPSTPTTGNGGTVKGQNVKIQLRANAVQTLGLPKGAPLASINVTLRDSDGNLVYVKDGAYAPSGQNSGGTSVIQLNPQNGFFQTLLLPAGQYSFENAGKYGDTLLTYGPDYENETTVDADHNVVMLKFHGVVDPMKSKLDFAMQTEHVYTGDRVNLKLNAQTAEIEDYGSFPVPLNDLESDGYDTNGADNEGYGSALGVSVIARGTEGNPNMSVTPYVSGWVRQGGSDTARMQPLNLPAFEHAIETSAVVADLEGPYNVSMNPVGNINVNSYVNLQGQASDGVAIDGIEVYDNGTLIATSSSKYGYGFNKVTTQSLPIAPVFTDDQGNWSADWIANTPGTHQLTVVARDRAGNETPASQTVMVAALGGAQGDVTANLSANRTWVGDTEYTLAPNATFYMKVNAASYPYPWLNLEVDAQSGPTSEFTASYGLTRENADVPIDNNGYYYWSQIQRTESTYWLKVVNTTDHVIVIRPYVGD